MATYTTNVQADFSQTVGFFLAESAAVVSLTSTQMILKTPSGLTQIYEGSFFYSYNGGYQIFDWSNGSTVTAIKNYANDGTFVASTTGLSIIGDVIKSYADLNDSNGLRSYAFRGNDTISGSSYGDVIWGYTGNDIINGKGGNDIIDGGEGEDIAIYSGQRSEYTITKNFNGSWNIADSFIGRDGTDTLTNFKIIQFSDTVVDLTFFDATAPIVIFSTPADSTTGVLTTANIVIVFNEPIQQGTGNIALKTAAGITVETFDAASSGHLSISGSTLTIDPTYFLAYGTTYCVAFTPGTIKDLTGNSYTGTISYDFTTIEDGRELPGFDRVYYLDMKLDALQAGPGTAWIWANKDTAYLESVLAGAGFTPEAHYMAYGYQEGLAPNAYFNPTEYKLAKATDMFNHGGYGSISAAEEVLESAWPFDFYQHYLQYGSKEGINPSNSFDESSYYDSKLASLHSNPLSGWNGKTSFDLKALFDSLNITPLQHYLMYGANEGIVVTSVPTGERVGSAAIGNNIGMNQAEVGLIGVVVSPEPEVGY